MCENSAYTNTHFFFVYTRTRRRCKKDSTIKRLRGGASPPKKVGIRFRGDPADRLFLETCRRSLCCPKSGGLMVSAVKF